MRQVTPLEKRIQERRPTSWTDVVELAEVAWWGIAHRGGGDRYSDHDSATVVKAILALGGGERFFIWDEGTVGARI
jgi:hypothetical protein